MRRAMIVLGWQLDLIAKIKKVKRYDQITGKPYKTLKEVSVTGYIGKDLVIEDLDPDFKGTFVINKTDLSICIDRHGLSWVGQVIADIYTVDKYTGFEVEPGKCLRDFQLTHKLPPPTLFLTLT